MHGEKIRKKILEELRRHGNISVACANSGISRDSFYRWTRIDTKFKKDVDDAIWMGINAGCDLGESVLFKLMKQGNFSAAKYYLENNHPRYLPHKRTYPSAVMRRPPWEDDPEAALNFLDKKGFLRWPRKDDLK